MASMRLMGIVAWIICLSSASCAAPIDETAVKHQLEAQYARIIKAYKARDVQEIGKLLSPEFEATGPLYHVDQSYQGSPGYGSLPKPPPRSKEERRKIEEEEREIERLTEQTIRQERIEGLRPQGKSDTLVALRNGLNAIKAVTGFNIRIDSLKVTPDELTEKGMSATVVRSGTIAFIGRFPGSSARTYTSRCINFHCIDHWVKTADGWRLAGFRWTDAQEDGTDRTSLKTDARYIDSHVDLNHDVWWGFLYVPVPREVPHESRAQSGRRRSKR